MEDIMRLERVSLKNIWNHRGRVGFLTVALVVAVATIVALNSLSNMMQLDFQRQLDEYGSNMVIVPKQDELALSYGGVSLGSVAPTEQTLRDEDVEKLMTIKNSENLAVISPKIIGAASIKDRDALVVGVRFEEELRIKKWWELSGGREARQGRHEALAGAHAARELGLAPGDSVEINGEAFKVVGVLEEIGSEEDRPLYIGLQSAQRLFDRPGQLDLMEVAAWCYDCPIEVIVGQTLEKLPHADVAAVIQASKARNRVVTQFNLFALVLSLAVGFSGSLIIFANMTAAVRERRREIGIFRAVGFRGLNILEIILFEVVLLALFGGLVGYLLGVGAAVVSAPALGLSVPVAFDPTTAYFAVLGTILLTILSSLYPAITAARLSPLTALNDI